jgi:TatD DNase family protein
MMEIIKPMFLVDSHCHLGSLSNNQDDIDRIIKKAYDQGVKFILAVSTTISEHSSLRTLIGNRKNIALSAGIHPLYLENNYDIDQLYEIASDSSVVALGETGLDYYYDKDSRNKQIESFRTHIHAAISLKKPLIVHTRNAREDTLKILNDEHASSCGGVLHCFTEDRETASKLLDMGFYISLSGIITFKSAKRLVDLVRYLPDDRILIETDSPYLSPVPFRGIENQPAHLRNIAEFLSNLKKIDIEILAEATTKNFFDLFKVSPGYQCNNG